MGEKRRSANCWSRRPWWFHFRWGSGGQLLHVQVSISHYRLFERWIERRRGNESSHDDDPVKLRAFGLVSLLQTGKKKKERASHIKSFQSFWIWAKILVVVAAMGTHTHQIKKNAVSPLGILSIPSSTWGGLGVYSPSLLALFFGGGGVTNYKQQQQWVYCNMYSTWRNPLTEQKM